MAGRTPQEAVRNFLAPLKAVVGCITSEGFVTRFSPRSDEPQTAAFQGGFAILTRRSGKALSLELAHRYTVTKTDNERESWEVSTAEYIYDVSDESDELIAAFHWHPLITQVGEAVQWPHLHAYGARDALTLHKLHLPTGRISLEAVIRFLIEDLDVVPLRDDWSAILDRHEQAFRQARSWS